jgi:ketosteroid isomerase-like protein
MSDRDPAIQRLLDEAAIRRCIAKYPRALDRHDSALLASMFHPDAIDDHGPYNGTAAGYVDWMAGRNRPGRHWMHHYGNQIIDFESDEVAYAETYCIGCCRITGEDEPDKDIFLRVRYLDKMEKRDDDWRISHRKVVYSPSHVIPVVEEFPPADGSLWEASFPDDPVYKWTSPAEPSQRLA